MLNNQVLARLFTQNMQSLGHEMNSGDLSVSTFSTDVGNVSQLVPTIQPLVAIAPPDVLIHSPQFAEAAASETGFGSIMEAAKAMAMTVVDLLAGPDMFSGVEEEFRRG